MTNNSKSSSSPSPARYTDRGIPNDSKNKRFAGQSRSNSRGASNHRPQTSTPPVGSDVQKNQKNRRISVINNTNHNNNSLRTKTSEVHVSHKIGRELNRNFHRKQKRGSVVNGVYQQHAKHRYSITAPLPSVDHISTQHKAKSYSAQSPNLYRKGNRNVKSLPNPQNRGNKMQHRGRTMERNKQTKKLSISMERTNAKFLEMKNQEMNKDVEWNRQFLPDHHYVYTDGSWKAPNLGGVGIYHGPDHILNRSFKVYKPNVYLCEVEAIKTTLQDLLKDGSYKSKTIVIRTDCLETITAVRTLTRKNSATQSDQTDIHDVVNLCFKFPKGVYIEHVYAHDTDTDYGNLAADMLARVALSESNNGKSRVRDRSLDRNRLLSKNNNVDLIDTHRVFVGGKLTRSDSESSRCRKNSSNHEASITDVPPSYTGSFNIPAMTEPSYCMTIGTDVPEHLTHFIPACAEMPEDSLGDSCAMVVPKNFTVVKEPKDYHQSNNEARAPDTGLSSVIREVTDTDNSGEWNDQAEEPEDCLTKCLMFFKNAITFCCKSKQ